MVSKVAYNKFMIGNLWTHLVKIAHIEKWGVMLDAPLIYHIGQIETKNVKTVYLLCKYITIQVVIVQSLKTERHFNIDEM